MAFTDGHRSRLRERFAQSGLSGFLPHEVVELLLTFSIPRRDVKRQAHELLEQFGSISAILDADCDELEKINGIGQLTVHFLALIRSLAHVYIEQKSVFSQSGSIPRIEDWALFWSLRIGHEKIEHFEAVFLDSKLRPQRRSVERLASGSNDAVVPLPRKILSAVLRSGCSAVVMCHNHPDGSPIPSEHDERFTHAIGLQLRTLGVRLIDHIVVAGGKAFSVSELCEIPFKLNGASAINFAFWPSQNGDGK
ncbi:MAG: Mov34/MPN/PAD-1 family protein [Puniceicoccales bacterium]|jgi:DNA repair protein RadC|nr:Mov34/MPN/PAD-1 family protein [Puniceicoccales bacterium]